MEKVIDPEMDRKIANEPKNIPGWGMDADPENDPTYPMKHRNGADYERIHYERAPQQQQNIEVLHSIERPGITRVFGTSTPPSGLSGAVRRFAFKYSEATAAHWMSLILADRINVVEGVIEDIRKGKVPNLVSELGWPAEWKYNRKNFITRMAVKVAVVTLVTVWLTRKKK
jgi:hypothetical protein